jgi:hypothetical protein
MEIVLYNRLDGNHVIKTGCARWTGAACVVDATVLREIARQAHEALERSRNLAT